MFQFNHKPSSKSGRSWSAGEMRLLVDVGLTHPGALARRHGVGRIARRMALLDEGFHPYQVRIHFALRIGAEEPGQRVTDRPGRRVITQLDMDSVAALMRRLEVYDAAVTDRRAWHALPSQEFVANQFGDLSRPFNRQAGRPGDGPMRTAIACGPRLAHIGHKTRKVVVIGPEIEN